ncbi:hypothetical protein [Cupriavidus sp. CuC1]|uniref:hypothetical protein n=1 Tax=Cupriavidus sp. CuC1 TaxID=3373131 RepID=UPI0037CE7F4E
MTYPKALIRYLATETGKSEDDCSRALASAKGDIMAAHRLLSPAVGLPPYHPAYYLGPFRRVADPDRDLPVREKPLPWDQWDDEYVMVRDMAGQRCIPPFRDTNELGDIQGSLYFASGYPDWEDWAKFETPTIQGCLMVVADRIRDKLKRNKIPARGELFKVALDAVQAAQDLYFDGRYEAGGDEVWKAVKALTEGNRLRKKAADS